MAKRSKSAQKSARVSKKRHLCNKSVKSQVKTYVAKAERTILSQEYEDANQAVIAAIKVLDKSVKKGVLHRNTAARRKSRLMKKLNQLLLSRKT